jgi:hypothetical protein
VRATKCIGCARPALCAVSGRPPPAPVQRSLLRPHPFCIPVRQHCVSTHPSALPPHRLAAPPQLRRCCAQISTSWEQLQVLCGAFLEKIEATTNTRKSALTHHRSVRKVPCVVAHATCHACMHACSCFALRQVKGAGRVKASRLPALVCTSLSHARVCACVRACVPLRMRSVPSGAVAGGRWRPARSVRTPVGGGPDVRDGASFAGGRAVGDTPCRHSCEHRRACIHDGRAGGVHACVHAQPPA